jgi:hypothetical protein
MNHSLLPLAQYEVEQAFINAGYLLPSYHLYYWMGYSAKTWPKFLPLDKTVPFDSPAGNYTYWGYFNNSAAPVEPDGGVYGRQLCVAANYTEAYSDYSTGNGSLAFGWADNNCSLALPYMCRINCESGCWWYGGHDQACKVQQIVWHSWKASCT